MMTALPFLNCILKYNASQSIVFRIFSACPANSECISSEKSTSLDGTLLLPLFFLKPLYHALHTTSVFGVGFSSV